VPQFRLNVATYHKTVFKACSWKISLNGRVSVYPYTEDWPIAKPLPIHEKNTKSWARVHILSGIQIRESSDLDVQDLVRLRHWVYYVILVEISVSLMQTGY
jgi:hypothetical protein